MEQTTSWSFFDQTRQHLSQKGYIEVRPPESFEFAMLKQTFGGTIPKAIAVYDARFSTDSPTTIFGRHKKWFSQLLGNTGSGALIFVYHQPSASIVDEALQLGKGLLGAGPVVAGVYDIASGKHWMSDFMGLADEVFS